MGSSITSGTMCAIYEWVGHIWLCHNYCAVNPKARAYSLPAALGKLSVVLNPAEKKDPRGKKLIQLLSVPRKPTKADPMLYRTFAKYPELYGEMYEYNIQDINAEKSISSVLPDLSPFELEVWRLDQRINVRGVQIDIENLDHCIRLFGQVEQKYTEELQQITGGAVNTIGEMAKLKSGDTWLQSLGVHLSSLDKAHVQAALERTDLPVEAHRALQIRQEMGGAAAKKIFALKRCLNNDGRIRELYSYCGADRTGRFAGRGPQPQNLRNGGPDVNICKCGFTFTGSYCPACGNDSNLVSEEWGDAAAETALAHIRSYNLNDLEIIWGSVTDLIGSCMRSLFIAKPEHDLICLDFNAIEAIVIAALAGEEWRLEVFRTHGKIYEASIAQSSSVSLEEMLDYRTRTGNHHPLRKKGKVRELAYGYQGWIGAAKQGGHPGTDNEIKEDILAWRDESPMIVEFWGGQYRKTPMRWEFTPELYGAEGMFIAACLSPGVTHSYRSLDFVYNSAADALSIRLLSGRCLTYHAPRLENKIDPRGLDVWAISYMGVDAWTGQWVRKYVYGGKIAAHITSATARDIQVASMLRLDAAGYPIVLHTHDETTAEVPKGFGSIEEFEHIAMQREYWFADWPIKASGGWRGHRYRK